MLSHGDASFCSFLLSKPSFRIKGRIKIWSFGVPLLNKSTDPCHSPNLPTHGAHMEVSQYLFSLPTGKPNRHKPNQLTKSPTTLNSVSKLIFIGGLFTHSKINMTKLCLLTYFRLEVKFMQPTVMFTMYVLYNTRMAG